MDLDRNEKMVGTVLIVDDTPTNLEVLQEVLTNANYEVLVAIDGESAIDQIQYARPDIILLDVMMPGMDGFETCRRLKANPDTSAIPVIFMTALSETADKVKGFETGAVDYITKPFQHSEVLARVKTQITLSTLQKKTRRTSNPAHTQTRKTQRHLPQIPPGSIPHIPQ